jgi:hypothetical protein
MVWHKYLNEKPQTIYPIWYQKIEHKKSITFNNFDKTIIIEKFYKFLENIINIRCIIIKFIKDQKLLLAHIDFDTDSSAKSINFAIIAASIQVNHSNPIKNRIYL